MANIEKEMEALAYQVYTAEILRVINENIANCIGGENIVHTYIDIIGGNTQMQDNRTGDEIARDVIERHGLKVKGGSHSLPNK